MAEREQEMWCSPEEEQFHTALITAGLVREIKPPRVLPVGERRLIQVEGKPLSETIIEERGTPE